MISLDAATVLLQWAVGGLLFLWVTTRGREVGIGYGWLVRGTYIAMAAGAFALGLRLDTVPVREVSSLLVVVAASLALGVSIVRRRAGVAGAGAAGVGGGGVPRGGGVAAPRAPPVRPCPGPPPLRRRRRPVRPPPGCAGP